MAVEGNHADTSFGWTIRKYVNIHSCSSSIMHRDHCQSKSRVIGSYIKTKFKDVKRIFKPKNIIDDFHKDLEVNISYDKAWRSREKALDMIRGLQRNHSSYFHLICMC